MEKVRVRFAPSPTGSLHIGGARTALFNWLLARHYGGTFVLRIDDTDTQRSTEASTREIFSALRWLGIDWDEGPEKGGAYGPYYQSQRLDLYQSSADRLLASGQAYYCYCTPEEIAARRTAAKNTWVAPYDSHCRNLTEAEKEKLKASGRLPALRLQVPDTGQTDVEDIVRSHVSFQNQIIGDIIIMKSNGVPTYNFACVVDDYFMEISHVIRAEEHLSNTPKQIVIYQALGYPLPSFAHVPMILAPDRSKLSKRHGATSVEELRDDGYLPEAILNYLSLLGWSPEGEEEILPLTEIASRFSLERVSRNPAIYDLKKLTWMNGPYLREQDLEKTAKAALPFFQQKGLVSETISPETYQRVKAATGVVRDRVKTLAEVADAAYYFFRDDFSYEPKGVNKHFKKEKAAAILQEAGTCLAELDDFSVAGIETAYRDLTERLQIKTSEIFHPTRLAVTGRTVGPGLFDLMALVGKEKVLERLDRAVKYIQQLNNDA